MKYLYQQKNNDLKIFDNQDEVNNNKTEQNIIKKETKDLDDSFSDVSCSIFNVVNSKMDKVNKKVIKNNINNISNPIIGNKISEENSLICYTNNKRQKANKNSHIKKDIISMNANKMKLQKIVKTDNNFIRFTPNSKSYIINNKNNNRNGIKLAISRFENSKSENNIMKYLKINKTSDERRNKLKYKYNRCDYTNNNIKERLNVVKKEHKLLLRPINSFRNINNDNQFIKINSIDINTTKIQLNKKNKLKNISCDYKHKKKINFKKDISIKDTESNIINNTSDFNDTNDERNITPKKKSNVNKVKPQKLLEAFKKELVTKKIIY